MQRPSCNFVWDGEYFHAFSSLSVLNAKLQTRTYTAAEKGNCVLNLTKYFNILVSVALNEKATALNGRGVYQIHSTNKHLAQKSMANFQQNILDVFAELLCRFYTHFANFLVISIDNALIYFQSIFYMRRHQAEAPFCLILESEI